MSKILVTGNAGSGKSTLARKIAISNGLPLFSMDKIVWQERWKKPSADDILRKTNELIEKDSWVIDGVSFEVMAAADLVIFLDFPRRVSFWRTTKRNYKYLFRSRPELPPHCPEILIIPKLVKIIWNFPARVKPKLLERKMLQNESFIHITSNEELKEYLCSQHI